MQKGESINVSLLEENDNNQTENEPFDLFKVVQQAREVHKMKARTPTPADGDMLTLDDFKEDGKIDVEKLKAYVDKHGDTAEIGPSAQCQQNNCQDILQTRRTVDDHEHVWTDYIGTRFSKKRGCCQFWVWVVLGIIVGVLTAVQFASLSLDDVLNLGAFSGEDQGVGEFAFVMIRDEVEFTIEYSIQSADDVEFQVVLLKEDDFENWRAGKSFEIFAPASTSTPTTDAQLERTLVPNNEGKEYVLVIHPCIINELQYCNVNPLPTSLNEGSKVFRTFNGEQIMQLSSYFINPDPQACSASGDEGYLFLLIFLPWLIVLLFGLRIFHMLFFCRSFRSEIELEYTRESEVPEEEVDYWQPNPWDRKVPKTRLLGPCCWKKIRRPFEPFYTWYVV